MEPLIVGGLTAVTAVLGVAFWQLLVRPEALLALWADPDRSSASGLRDPRREAEGWFDHHPGTLRALRYSLGTVLFLSGFLTGLTLTFLLGT
jgi:cytochrome P450